jgi:E3 ubiquitin-protein ligase HERC2
MPASSLRTAVQGKNDVGLNREKWTVNPGATSELHLAMFEFVGVLLGASLTIARVVVLTHARAIFAGIALRTKIPLALNLPSLFWKQLVGEQVGVADLEAIDKLCVQALTEVRRQRWTST